MPSLVPSQQQWKNDSSSYLRFDIYVDFALFYVDFVELQEGTENTEEGRVFSAFSVNINIQRGSGIIH